MDKPHSLAPPKTSILMTELNSLPVLQAASELYKSTKTSSALFNTGCTILEYSCTAVLGRLYSGEGVGSKLDSMAGVGMARLKEKYPSIQQSPDELRSATSYLVRSTVRKTMKTLPGQLVVKSLDWIIDGTESLLTRVSPRNKSPRKRKLTRAKLREIQPVSEDSGACDADADHQRSHKSQQTTKIAVEKLARGSETSLLTKAYKLGIVLPLDALVNVLRYVRWYMGGRRRNRMGQRLTPEKRAEIESRRKISPRKRVHINLLENLKYKACRILGIKTSRLDRYELQNLALPNEYDDGDHLKCERKRKHDEIVTSGSDTDEDYADFDFDNYDSEEDPDYRPDEDSAGNLNSDSSSSDAEEVESDMDQETVEGGPHIQLKERKRSTKTQSPATSKRNGKPKDEKPVAREADSSVDHPLGVVPGDGIVPGTTGNVQVVGSTANQENFLQPQWRKDSLP